MFRKDRAKYQTMYCLNSEKIKDREWTFDIQGNSDNIYKTYISDKIHTCSCPDFKLRGIRCKHILFVIIRIANDAYTFSEIDNEKNIYDINPAFDILLEHRVMVKKSTIDDDCVICYESMNNTFTKECSTCKNTFHTTCISKWTRINNTCPLCRSLV